MALPAEDMTLETAKDLTDAGLTRDAADAVAQAIHRSTANLPTKQDFERLEQALEQMAAKQDAQAEKFATKDDFKRLELALEQMATNMATKQDVENASTKTELSVATAQRGLLIHLVTWIIACAGIVAALIFSQGS